MEVWGVMADTAAGEDPAGTTVVLGVMVATGSRTSDMTGTATSDTEDLVVDTSAGTSVDLGATVVMVALVAMEDMVDMVGTTEVTGEDGERNECWTQPEKSVSEEDFVSGVVALLGEAGSLPSVSCLPFSTLYSNRFWYANKTFSYSILWCLRTTFPSSEQLREIN
ncbi:hypothetical protein RvY_19296-1 [Ramazzottius varieornatus]|uniref:Uncharacterized protein n=1 Tax=Ramazzottius varieornatus TaxID=947166 RepID=A0A1D1W8Y9_RAMVA|nr:hypothetical protein RvY_19296-1 [Ramazzottius varieornatus]